ncbi:hypothetical protein tb265_44620 [Gemmatimonadetes bacterium T265]|nr:hypothetical protein tb265_44620 [Gemmatimonadetes bacterium T265]
MPERAAGGPVGVVGLGLVGGSLARALLARGVRVLGAERDPGESRRAARCGVEVVDGAAQLAAALPAGGTVVLAVPRAALGAVAAAVLPRLAPGATVLHAAGLQRPEATGLPAAAAGRVVGTHPLAGSHEAGFAASRADLFAGATVWAEARADAATRARLEWLWTTAGAATVRYETAAAHDAAMAWTSHLPQLASTALAAALAAAGVPAAAGGPGLRDTTRLAASPLPLWRDLLAAAPPETDAALAALADAVAALRAALAAGDAAALDALWERARAWRCAPTAADQPSAEDRASEPGESAATPAAAGARW